MAEEVIIKFDIGAATNNIARLEAELKKVKQEYKAAEIGSKEFYKAQDAGKQLTAEIKKQNDALKANTNALNGINQSAKFGKDSYGALKQSIKTTKDELLKLDVGSDEFIKTQKELVALEQKRIDVEKQIPSLFQERIKGAVDEANTLKDLKAQIKEYTALSIQGYEGANEKLAELKDKLADVQDATKTFTGSGVERLNASMGLLTESIQNFDGDKFKTALEGIGGAMKVIPIFLIIEGIKLLIENFDEAVKFLQSFTDESKDVKRLEKALAEVTRESEKQKVALQGLVDVGNAQIELLKAQGASYDKIIGKEKEVFNSKLQLIRVEAEQIKASALANVAKLKEIQANDSVTEGIKRLAGEYQRLNGNNILADQIDKQIAEDKKKRSKELTDALAEDQNKLTKLQSDLQVLLIENKTKEIETGKERREKARELQDFLRQLSIDAIKDEKDRQVNQLIFDEEVAKREAKLKIKNKELLNIALADIDKSFRNQQLELEKQFFAEELAKQEEKTNKQLEDAKARKLQEIENEKAGLELVLNAQEQNLTEVFEARKKLLQIQKEEELNNVNLSYNERLAIQQKYNNEELRLEQERIQKKAELRNGEIEFAKQTANALLNITNLFAQNQEQQAAISKVLALVNIAANTAQAISGLTAISFQPSVDTALNPLAPYIKLATGIATITANAIQAKQLLNSFEEGGYTGDGATNEVSTNLGSKPYTYHKGEYVIPARVLNTPTGTAMASQLESMRLGMSNPMPYIGGMFDGGFTARSSGQEANNTLSNNAMIQQMLANLPQPVVRVTDINKVQGDSKRVVQATSL